MDIRKIRDPYAALGIAMHFIAHRQPFADFRAADLWSTLDGQIRRGHYLMAFEGQRMVGYMGWALFDHETARKVATGGVAPSNVLAARFAQDGEVVWLMTVASTEATAVRRLAAAGKRLYPGKPVYGVRRRAHSTLKRGRGPQLLLDTRSDDDEG